MYQLAIFDMDGTILNTLEDLKISINHALIENGFPERTFEEVRRFVGNGTQKLVERSVPEGTGKEKQQEVLASFDEYYAVHCADYTKPYQGIVEALQELKKRNIKTAVVSNKPDYGVQSLCEKYFKGLFDFPVGMKEGMRKKPAPDAVLQVLEHLGAAREDAVFIGDSDVDVQTALNAHLTCVGVTWGFRDREVLENAGAKIIVDDTEEMLKEILAG